MNYICLGKYNQMRAGTRWPKTDWRERLLRWRQPSDVHLQETQILRFLLTTAMRAPKLTIAVALCVLALLASMLTYTTYLVVGVLAEYFGLGRGMAGLVLAALFARFPWISKGRPRIVGVLPKPARRPVMVSLLLLCCLHFMWHGEYGPSACTGFATAFLLAYPSLRRTVFDRTVSSVFGFAGKKPAKGTDNNVIDVEFTERKD